jgi:hypothetical protein
MTRVRMRHFLRIPDGEYDLVQFDEDGHWVVRDEHGDVFSEEHDSPRKVVEVQLPDGRWVDSNEEEALNTL